MEGHEKVRSRKALRIGLIAAGLAFAAVVSGCSGVNHETTTPRAMFGTAPWSDEWASSCSNMDLADGPEDLTVTPDGQYLNAYEGSYYTSEGGFWLRYPYLSCDHYARAQELGTETHRAVAVNDAK